MGGDEVFSEDSTFDTSFSSCASLVVAFSSVLGTFLGLPRPRLGGDEVFSEDSTAAVDCLLLLVLLLEVTSSFVSAAFSFEAVTLLELLVDTDVVEAALFVFA